MWDVSNCIQNESYYGGLSCLKMGVTIDGIRYMMKFPGNLKDRNLKNVTMSYSNGPVSEYIGSHIYESLGIPVHETGLALYKGKVVVLCKDFLEYGDTLYEFRQIKATYPEGFLTPDGEASDGTGSDLDEALTVIRNHIAFKRFPEYENFFWKMFIVDAIIGNGDRNNGNYGIINNGSSSRIAPVYDNGNCLNPTWDDEKILKVMDGNYTAEVYKGKTCFFTRNGSKLNPFQVISSGEFPECTKALREVLRDINISKIYQIVSNIDCISDTQFLWYMTVLKERIQYLQAVCPEHSIEMYKYAQERGLDYADLVGRIYATMPSIKKKYDDKELCANSYWKEWLLVQEGIVNA